MSLDDARTKMEDWRRDYNELRAQRAIGNKVPTAADERLHRRPRRAEP